MRNVQNKLKVCYYRNLIKEKRLKRKVKNKINNKLKVKNNSFLTFNKKDYKKKNNNK